MIPRLQILPFVATIMFFVISFVSGDMYLHVPRGSNNRLKEKSAARTNANRMFNSENNNRGGYNVGDAGSEAAENADQQYMMKYFQSGSWKTMSQDKGKSKLTIEWTNQHGCGGNEDNSPQKQNCAIVMQYMCQDEGDTNIDAKDKIRNGFKINTQDYTNVNNKNVDSKKQKNGNVKLDRGLHETWDWYNKCYLRERNKGLFTADQKLNNNGLGYSSAIYTRQNPTGNRYGYECQEEKDYFPYWHPTPWTDVAVYAENSSMCSHYTDKSFNVQPYGECIEGTKGWSRYNNKIACEQNSGKWYLMYNYLEKATDKSKGACEGTTKGGVKYKWAIPYDSANKAEECLVMLDKPECKEAPWTRSNHLGNGEDGLNVNYTWTLPYFPSGKEKRCVFRIRYNISTDDYDPYNTDYKSNAKTGVKSPVTNNPYVYVMEGEGPLRLAINTAQYGRVFQDRSHAFLLRSRPAGLNQERIFNVNVRGKRGNIVQTYPAVEYDFAPNQLDIKEKDLVHFQWTGSNTHNNGAPAGDGQAGSAGEGKDGTDRNNVVEMSERSGNFPAPFENTKMWNAVKVEWIYHGKKDIKPRDLAINMASSGYYHCNTATDCPGNTHKNYLVATKTKMNNLLDNAPASYEGVLLRYIKKGTYHYMCTRNNNFTNRSQKAAIVVS